VLINYEDRYFSTDTIAIITDYSFSHISDNLTHIGYYKQIAYSVFPSQSWIMTDAYKLLLSSVAIAINVGNLAVLSDLKYIFRYFSDENLLDAVTSNHQSNYNLCYNSVTAKMKLSSFINHVEVICDVEFNDYPIYELVNMNTDLLMKDLINQVKWINFNKVDLLNLEVLNDVKIMYSLIAELIVLSRSNDKFNETIDKMRVLVSNNSNYFDTLSIQIIHDERLLWYWDKMAIYEQVINLT
jgi:hypothetical protein